MIKSSSLENLGNDVLTCQSTHTSQLLKDNTHQKYYQANDSTSAIQDNSQPNSTSIYNDHLDHLEDLELEAKLMLAAAFFRTSLSDCIEKKLAENIGLLELQRKVSALADIESWQSELKINIERKELESEKNGIELPFVSLCLRYQLDTNARCILLLVIVANTSTAFKSAWSNYTDDNDIEAGRLLSLLSKDFRSRLDNRRYLSLESALINNNLLKLKKYRSESFDEWDIELEDWVIPYILDDQNNYDTDSFCISEMYSTVSPDRLILSDDLKIKVLNYARNYTEALEKRQQSNISDYFEYGNGLVMLFHGPSGTGKTMLTHAVANQLQCPLYNLDLGVLEESELSFEEGIKSLFRQAKLGKGIAFIDECDDILKKDCRDSRSMLIEMEKADCIIIMATNRPVDLDPAFDRRITFKAQFTLPDESQREELWKSMIPPIFELSKDVNLKELAKRFMLNGGLIKNAVQIAINSALQKQKKKTPIIKWTELQDAAAEQARSLFNADLLYRPNKSIDSLAVNQLDRTKLRNLAQAHSVLSNQGLGLSGLISVSDIDAGIDCADAFATDCKVAVRMLSFSETLFPLSTRKFSDPETQCEISGLEHAFRTKTGEEHVLVFVDRCGLWDSIQEADKDNVNHQKDIEFLEQVRDYKGILIIITNSPVNDTPPVPLSFSMTLGYPEKIIQMGQWQKYLSDTVASECEIESLVEDNPLLLSEIDSLGRQLKTMAIIESGVNSIDLSRVQRAIANMRGKHLQPDLFGQRS